MKIASFPALLLCAAVSIPSLHAANITQSANAPAGANWNQGSLWTGGAAPSAGNDYFTAGGFSSSATAFVTNGVTWNFTGTMRDDPAGSTFGGDSLTVVTNTRLLGKVEGGQTSNVNLIFGGGFFFAGPNGPGSATLAGTIRFADGIHIGAIGVNPAIGGSFTQTITSKVTGDDQDVLQLSLLTELGDLRLGHIIFTGDLSEFYGTIYVGTAASGTAVGSTYSVRSSSTVTSLILDTGAFGNAKYDLATSETFKSIVVGGTALDAGTYDATTLNSLAGGSFFTGDGSLTVVPEPATTAIAAAGLLGLVAAARRRSKQ